MAFQRILAMTEAEIRNHSTPPSDYACLGCHFSPEGHLVGLPDSLPSGCGLVIDDRNPITDSAVVTAALDNLVPDYVILDFQYPPEKASLEFAAALAQTKWRTVMPPEYAKGQDCPLFLPPVPPHVPIEEYLKPWKGREIWLELALDGAVITITAQGCQIEPMLHAQIPDGAFADSMLHCHYIISQQEDSLQFRCGRNLQDVEDMLHTPLPPNLKRAVGLFREFGEGR